MYIFNFQKNYLSDSHQQLIVHWAGEGSSVIICLARDPPSVPNWKDPPSALYISYDYGDTFVNKTDEFKFKNGTNDTYARLEKFYIHPQITSYVCFKNLFDLVNKNYNFYIKF